MQQPPTISWADAVEHILALARRRAATAIPVVGITGPVGSGKSTLASLLSGCILATDDYLPDYALVPMQMRDEPESSDLSSLARHLDLLRRGVPIDCPIWSFHEHRSTGSRRIAPPSPGGLIVCEGLHALHDSVRARLDVRVLVEAPAETRWRRWESLEQTGIRGWGVERARAHFDAVAEPTWMKFKADYAAAADFRVQNNAW